jgi:chromosome segregation ATPase
MRDRHRPYFDELEKNRKRVKLKEFPPALAAYAANQSTSGEKEMTYEQMEKTMQFMLDQQAAMTTKQSEFDEWRKQMAAESTERDRQFGEQLKQMGRQFDEQLKQVVATFAEQNGKIYEMMENTHTDMGTLSADALFFRETGEDHEKRINELHGAMSMLTRQMTSMSAKVEELTETVRNLIKGGSNGWPRN